MFLNCSTYSRSSSYPAAWIFYAAAAGVYLLKIPTRVFLQTSIPWLFVSLAVPLLSFVGLSLTILNLLQSVNPDTFVLYYTVAALGLEGLILVFEIPLEFIAFRAELRDDDSFAAGLGKTNPASGSSIP